MFPLFHFQFTHPVLMSRKVLLTDKGVGKVYDIWQEIIAAHRVSVLLSQVKDEIVGNMKE